MYFYIHFDEDYKLKTDIDKETIYTNFAGQTGRKCKNWRDDSFL